MEPEEKRNNVSKVLIFGFQNLEDNKYSLFCLLLLTFCVTICGNSLIIILVSCSKNLKYPMYFFLSQLSICDILLSITIGPITLDVVLNDGGTISLAGCILQYIIFLMSECSECNFLTVMSYDRYLAICNPLHYASIMENGLCKYLSFMCWTLSILYSLILSSSIKSLYFCGPNTIDHFFCDLDPLLKLSCSDVSFIHMEAIVLSVPGVVCPFLIIMASYICIVNAVLNISSVSGRQKAFFTCSSHLTVVCLYYGTVIAVYMFPTSLHTLTMNKIFTMIYTVMTPSLNPIIYSLRNKDIHMALKMISVK
ncbi:olfactory receptor 11L1-like [Pyxicephalus adspersus]